MAQNPRSPTPPGQKLPPMPSIALLPFPKRFRVPAPAPPGPGGERGQGDPALKSDLRFVSTFPTGRLDGPGITFARDGGGIGPNLLARPLAALLEDVVRETGISINVNSTTTGHNSPKNATSRHNIYSGVDINRVNGMRVDDPRAQELVRRLQDAVARQAAINENFGPSRNERRFDNGSNVQTPNVARDHRDHIHVSVLPPPSPVGGLPREPPRRRP